MICGYGWTVLMISLILELILILTFINLNLKNSSDWMKFQLNTSFSFRIPDLKHPIVTNPTTEKIKTKNILKIPTTTSNFLVYQKQVILQWTKYYNSANTPIRNIYCSNRCTFTTDRSSYNNASVVLYHGTDLNITDMPTIRSDKINIFWMRESPGRNNHFYRSWNSIPMSYFNSTITYKSDSDYMFPYFEFKKQNDNWKKSVLKKIDSSLKRRNPSNIIFALISHCKALSHRDELISEVNKHIRVDTFGRCPGSTSCNKSCEPLFGKYYFYLALENTICDEYVTEKLARMKHMLVPITISRRVVPDFVPPGSFIAIDDFCSVKELANHLNYLMKNQTAYREYLDWQTDFSLVPSGYSHVCDICDDLLKGTPRLSDYSGFSSIAEYMSPKECDNDHSLKILENKLC